MGAQKTASASAVHDGLAAAYQAQRDRLSPSKDMWSACAGNFKPDLHAPLSESLEKVGSFLHANEVLLDVGGGAGRLSLPLAGRCGEVICVDPSPAMADVFEATARDAEITNARFVRGDWLDVDGVEGDVVLVAHVTYFVPRIAPFIEKLNQASRRRVLIGTHSVAPPNQFAPFFELARGEQQALVPGTQELLAVLTEMGIEAEVIDAGPAPQPVIAPLGSTRDDAVRGEAEGGIKLGWLKLDETERATSLFLEHFDDLYVETDQGFRRRSALGARELIITWESRR